MARSVHIMQNPLLLACHMVQGPKLKTDLSTSSTPAARFMSVRRVLSERKVRKLDVESLAEIPQGWDRLC
jgi:hypothetical protein